MSIFPRRKKEKITHIEREIQHATKTTELFILIKFVYIIFTVSSLALSGINVFSLDVFPFYLNIVKFYLIPTQLHNILNVKRRERENAIKN